MATLRRPFDVSRVFTLARFTGSDYWHAVIDGDTGEACCGIFIPGEAVEEVAEPDQIFVVTLTRRDLCPGCEENLPCTQPATVMLSPDWTPYP